MAYILTGQKTGTVRFEQSGTITSEERSRSAKVTNNPIEDGSDVNDHVVLNPEQFGISGVTVGGGDAADRLVNMWRQRDILRYEGRQRIEDIVITSLSTKDGSENRDGISFKLTFQQVRTVSAMYVPMGATPLMSQQDAGKPVDTGMAKSSKGIGNAGRKTTSTETVSSGAYNDYINSYNDKSASSSGPNTRETQSYSGLEGNR